jgi:beta-aspartyl-dipeptidase (metallo-type)
MKFTLLEGGDLYTPRRAGVQPLLLADGKIARLGAIDHAALHAVGDDVEVLDVTNCIVTPGWIDPHAHIIGAGGEDGFASRMPEILVGQIACWGITTIVGLMGTDTTTRHVASLHAKAAQLCEEGLTAFIYTGGFELPPTTLTSSVMDDLVLIDKVIGTGEIAISDSRWIDPLLDPLAHIVVQTATGGKMAGKAGVVHFHTGSGKRKLGLLHELLDCYDLPAAAIYPTHVNRTEALVDDAIALARRGCYVDMDTVEEDVVARLPYYLAQGGPPDRITISSDAHTPGGSIRKLYGQLVACVREARLPLETVLPCLTSNPAAALKLGDKGALAPNKDADVVVLTRDTLEIVHVFARGRQFVRNGAYVSPSRQEQQVESGKE